MTALEIIAMVAREAGVMQSRSQILPEAIRETAAGFNARAAYLISVGLRKEAAAQRLQAAALDDLASRVSDPNILSVRVADMHRSGQLRVAVGGHANDLLSALGGPK